MPPYKSILATLQGDQLDAALAYAGVGGQHSHPALPQGVSFAPYPALPSADSYLSSPFGTFASSALSPAASPVSNEVHSSPDFPVEVRSEAPSASPAADGGVLPVAAAPASSEPSAPAPPAVPAADPALPSFDEIQGLPSPQSTDTAVAEKPLSEDPTEDQDDTVDEESQSDGIPDIYVPDAPTVLVVEDEAGTEDPPAATPEGTAAPEVTTDAVTDDNGGDGESPTDKPTRLVIKPVAKAEAGEDGVAIALPVSQAVVRGNHPVIVDYDPEVSAVAGANGMAHAMGELVLTYVNTTAPPTSKKQGLKKKQLNLAPDAVLVPYYGGAKGQYLIVARPVAAADLFKKKKSNKKKPGHKEEEEEEENVGEEADEEKPKPPPSDSSDTVTIVQPPPNASMAEAKPVGIAVAGEGGVASSRPQATALVGPGGLAVAKPIATAVAGIQGAEILLSGAGGLSGFSAGHPATLLYPVGSGPGPVHPLGGPLTTVYLHQAGVHPIPVAQPLQPLPPQPWLVYPAPPPPPFPYA
ncbi:hypothetical protein ONE63_006825 [Megalurothrips usitatus]|uniref:DUF4774 domain-containing protein n=1 Tax=Megalurothrips usitatus TaxID=439358 RepID=A0AAV7XWH7_9NEOP|nr:hypothetical protein ONE63_006825 [Megalurothrips usitatus]